MKPLAVLIVEDEGVVAEDLQQTLLEFGYDAFAIAMSAEEAIQRATERCPDVVLMDIRIKGRRDGIETARLMREQFRVPVVFLTAHADEKTIQRAKTTEPYGYLTKPVRAGELRSAIEIAVYRSEMERRLRERERWFSTTLHSIADAVVTVDLAGRITFLNAEAEQLTGLCAADVVGKPSRDVLRLMADQLPMESPLDRAMSERRSVVLAETGLVNAQTGATRSISESAAPVVDEGRMLGAVMVFRDITEQKQVQKQLELADRLASLATMAAGVAHEVNNPLTVVVANASFIEDDIVAIRSALQDANSLSPRIEERLAEIHRAIADVSSAGGRIKTIVADLRSFSRPHSSGAGQADVLEAVHWALRTTATEVLLRARVTTKLAPVPTVNGDEARLGQVLVNLVLNAAQSFPPGRAEANVIHVATSLHPNGSIVIEVRDTGCGMTDDVQSRIFDPFFTTKRFGVGTGLGLSISRGIVTSFGGEIGVESTLGTGTTVRVTLPPTGGDGPAAIDSSAARAVPRVGRILAVDDEPVVLRAVKRMLRDHDVTCSQSVREALALLERGVQFDMILSDLAMPGLSGVDFYEAVLAISPDLAKRIVFVTGGAITTRSEAFLHTVPNRCIEKPFSAATLESAVQTELARSSACNPTG